MVSYILAIQSEIRTLQRERSEESFFFFVGMLGGGDDLSAEDSD